MPQTNPIQIQRFLKGIDYPASKAELLDKARELGADDQIGASLERLPDKEYEAPSDVNQALSRQH